MEDSMFVSKFATALTPAQEKLAFAAFPAANSNISMAILRDPAVALLLGDTCRLIVTQGLVRDHKKWPMLSLVTLFKNNAPPYAVGLWAQRPPKVIPTLDDVLREGARLKGNESGVFRALGTMLFFIIFVWSGLFMVFHSHFGHVGGQLTKQEAFWLLAITLGSAAISMTVGFLTSFRTKRRLFSAALA